MTRKFRNMLSRNMLSRIIEAKLKNDIFEFLKNIDICLLELDEDIIEIGKINNLLLKTMCLPDKEPSHGSKCFTSGINRESNTIEAVSLNFFDQKYCQEYGGFDANNLCAGLPSQSGNFASFVGKYMEDFGGPLICLDEKNNQPRFTGVTSKNSLSMKKQPGLI